MDSEIENTEGRLKSLLSQIQIEEGILERIIYKGKNQHRRCQYFQFLLKVRRDINLLRSFGLDGIFGFVFPIIREEATTVAIHHQERKLLKGKYNILERIRGVARLLSQMVEPMLKAAIQISSLLARSFFMGFSLTVLAILARLRVLTQQMLLDVVFVYNLISSLPRMERPIKLNQDGLQVSRDYYFSSEERVTLECVWMGDKYVLHEETRKDEQSNLDRETEKIEDIPLRSSIQYQTIDLLFGDQCNYEHGDDGSNDMEKPITEGSEIIKLPSDIHLESVEDELNLSGETSSESSRVAIAGSSDLENMKSNIQSKPRDKVAFIPVRKSSVSDVIAIRNPKKQKLDPENLL